MATACSFLSEDHFLCSICLDVFTQPVSIPCGHNFCNACIKKHWEDKEHCQCPLCNQRFHKGLELRVNTGFREVVENFKEHHAAAAAAATAATAAAAAKPGQVPCDCCLGGKSRASKTCLVCLTSYCETHLEPHLRVAALKRHKLTDPVHNLEGQVCKKHNRMLELFCRTDQTCVCVLCAEHSSHDTIPLEEAIVGKRALMGKKKPPNVQESKQKRGKKDQKTKEALQTKRKGKCEAMSNCVASNQMHGPLMWWIPDNVNVPGNGDSSKGRFYREVAAEGDSSDSGGATGPMTGIKTFIPNPRIGNWVVRVGTLPNCRAQRGFPTHTIWMKGLKRVLVFVDYDNGLVSFYDANTAILVAAFSCNFTEVVYLFYSREDSWANRLREKAERIKAWSELPDTIFVLRCIAFFFVFAILLCIVAKHKL
ncbi:E3 ubiquitin-protein ligase TRIM41-like [Clinocottus analis]|uniref:E3 ubiquitin-protein ligase TRIM41-like n=1 Tax=Clinocottus analis TaxID=304258 RepID=UPI0035C0B0E4